MIIFFARIARFCQILTKLGQYVCWMRMDQSVCGFYREIPNTFPVAPQNVTRIEQFSILLIKYFHGDGEFGNCQEFEQSVDDRVKDGKRGGEYAMTL